ncbi:substrate-binding periplasmic protein [Undibacterium sp. RuTC16W]|uniref:substrate-binding periplasmic protein n=1 Tax=Undibacterium sp. RuTC16W TaxID=3413048 RepID=UPI003BEFA1D4
MAAPDNKTIIVTGDDFCPLTCNPASGKEGLAVDLIRRLFQPSGWIIEYQFLPFRRGIQYFKNAKVDLVPGVEKGGGIDFSDAHISTMPIISPRMCFYTHVNNPQWYYQNLSSLNEGKLGVISGYFYWPELRDYLISHKDDGKVEVVTSDNAIAISLRMLAKRRFDYFVELRPVVEYQLMLQNLKQDIHESSCVKSYPLYLAFRPGFAPAKELNAYWDMFALPLLKSAEGTAILQQYGLTLRSIFE